MKNIIKNVCLFFPCLLIGMASCDDMGSISEKYMEGGEIIYTGIVDSVSATPGNARVQLSWYLTSDPRISKTVIYWNEGEDSVEVSITASQIGGKVIKEIQLPEAYYLFELVTKDDEGHCSNPSEISVNVYGNRYIAELRNRSIQSKVVDATGLTINWFAIETTEIQYVTVQYTDYTDPGTPVPKTLKVENGDTSTALPGARAGDTFTVVTFFLPSGGLDMVSALAKEESI
jgi:hypothetical protein